MTVLYYPPTRNALQKTLDAQLDMGTTASTTLNNTTGVQNKPGVFIVGRIDSNGTVQPTSDWEWISYTGTSGSTLTGLTRGLGGSSDQDHAVGAIVEFVPDIVWAQSVITALALLVDESDISAVNTTNVVTPAGTQTLTNKTLTSPAMTTPSVTSGDMNLATGLNIQVNSADPKRGLYWPAQGMISATTSGAASGQIETTTNKVNIKVLDFDASSDEYACFNVPAPDYWDLSTITAQFYWTASTGSGDVIWGLQALARSNDDALDTAYGTAQTVTDTLIATGDEHITSATSAITVGGTPAKGDQVYFRVYRDADNGSDTLSGDARLIAVKIKFGIGQYDDQ